MQEHTRILHIAGAGPWSDKGVDICKTLDLTGMDDDLLQHVLHFPHYAAHVIVHLGNLKVQN